MADSKANIGVIVGGDISPLQKSLKKGSGLVSQFSGQVRGAANDIVKMGAAASVTAAVGLTAMFKSTAANTRELKNLAMVANTTTEEFQAMAFGANQFGIEQDKLADILKDTTDRVGDFITTGGGPMVDFFETIAPKVGVTIDQFKELSGPQALQLFVDTLQKAGASQQELTFHMEAMASDATLLIPLLRDNGALLAEMSKEAKELGLVMSDIDVAAIENANKQMDRAAGLFRGATQVISAEMAPIIEVLLDDFITMSKEAGGFGSIVKSSFGAASKVVSFLADVVRGVHVAFKGLHVAAAAVGVGVVKIFNGIANSIEFIVQDFVKGLNKVIEQANKIPKVDINRIGIPQLARGINELTENSTENLRILAAEFNELATKPLPSQNIDEFLERVNIASQKAAEVAKAAREVAEASQGPGAGNSGFDARIEALKMQYETEEQLLKEHREKMNLIGDEFDSSRFQTEDQWRSIREQAMSEHIDRMTRLRENEKSSAVNIAASLGSSIMSLAQGQSKRAFELGKKASVASATVKGIQAAVDAWQAGMSTGGPWAPAVAATYTAASLAKTGSIIRSLNAQSFSGGGGQPAAPGGGIPQTSAPAGAPAGGDSPAQASSVAIQLDPDAIVTGRGIIKLIEEAVENGANVNFIGAT